MFDFCGDLVQREVFLSPGSLTRCEEESVDRPDHVFTKIFHLLLEFAVSCLLQYIITQDSMKRW